LALALYPFPAKISYAVSNAPQDLTISPKDPMLATWDGATLWESVLIKKLQTLTADVVAYLSLIIFLP
jgi:hypothetical protein